MEESDEPAFPPPAAEEKDGADQGARKGGEHLGPAQSGKAAAHGQAQQPGEPQAHDHGVQEGVAHGEAGIPHAGGEGVKKVHGRISKKVEGTADA